MSYKLFLDDLRHPPEVQWGDFLKVFDYKNTISEVEVVRNYEDFCSIILKRGLPSIISFDHDLGPESYKAVIEGRDDDKLEEKTGLDCAKFLIEYCLDHRLALPKCHIHSMNPVGGRRIYDLLMSYDAHFRAFHG